MRLAVWNIQPCFELFGESLGDGTDVRFGSPEDCKKMLLDGQVDVALMGINEVLRSVDAFTILPELVLAAKSSRDFATLRLNRPIDEVRVVEASPDHRQAAEVTEILLREHYHLDVKVRYRHPIGTNGESPDAWIEFGSRHSEPGFAPTGRGSAEASVLDVSQEWFEMVGRPLVWGVFVTPGVSDTSGLGEELLDMATVQNLTSDGVRPRFDSDVLRGLDELAHYLFYFGKVDDIPMPRFSKSPDSIQPPQ